MFKNYIIIIFVFTNLFSQEMPGEPHIAWIETEYDLIDEPITVTISWDMWWGENGNHWKLIENSNNSNIGDFAVWELKKLHNRLETKHKETFWIKSANSFNEGIEYFDYKSINHTRRPIASQFDLLIGQGDITMDHLIKIKSNNQVSEKGPLFKIKKNNINLLFPSTIEYNLN